MRSALTILKLYSRTLISFSTIVQSEYCMYCIQGLHWSFDEYEWNIHIATEYSGKVRYSGRMNCKHPANIYI